MKKLGLFVLILVAIALPAAYMTKKILSEQSITCEVCMSYRGRSQCRKAQGPDRAACQQTGTDNACALLAAGMTESIACTSTEPVKVEFLSPQP